MGLFNFKKARKINSEYDFFKIDVGNIFQYPDIHFIKVEQNKLGQFINKYCMQLKDIELSMFDRLEIIYHETGSKTLVFSGKYNKLSNEAIDFINFCAEKYGPDVLNSGCSGKVTKQDLSAIMNGITFSRMWSDISIDNYNNTFELTLLGVPNSEGAVIPDFIKE